VSTPAPIEETTAETCYRHPDRQSFIHCQRCGRTICPQCQTPAAVGVQCPECVREGRASVAGGGGGGGARRRRRPRAGPGGSYVLMGLCIVAFAAQWLVGDSFTQAFLLNPQAIRSEPWRLLTSAFLHSPGLVFHILFNLYALFIFGPMLESFLGRGRYIALYLIGALGGSVGEVLVYQLAVVTQGASMHWIGQLLTPASAYGASGAIFALLGAIVALRKALGVQSMQLAIVVVINLAFSFFVPGIAWEVHVGGLITGFAIGSVFLRTRRTHQRALQLALVGAIAVVLVAVCVACVASQPAAYA
jgi:membrane associated rhomboid family serine protease